MFHPGKHGVSSAIVEFVSFQTAVWPLCRPALVFADSLKQLSVGCFQWWRSIRDSSRVTLQPLPCAAGQSRPNGLGQRQALDLLGSSLRQVYAEAEREPLPDRLRELVAKLEEAESESLHATKR
ncbi:NepR family anti-sigma factor [Microvirga massiliensis]|uniref:NepR family anti-sigma factor n=1 Tax=Microvirga massiliensis TaxID=1033741 RepID=UPI0011C925CA|nr:NepR family anti-sigma factor [Microvirga massiliensis]